MLIDSHHHLWKYSAAEYGWIDESMEVLRQDFLLNELRGIAVGSGVDGFVAVQARQSLAESEDLLRMAAEEPLIRGVVGWVPLADPKVGEHLDLLAQQDKLKGVRHVVQDEPDDRFLLGDEFNRGVTQLKDHGLVYDILIFARQLPASIEFVDLHPQLEMVLDHVAKPTIADGQFDSRWKTNLRELAKREQVTCKFSGVVTEVRDESWSIDLIRPYWDTALDAFGPKRLMFGSDWPVCLLRAEHRQWLDTVKQLASELSAAEQADLFANNAIRAYHLSNDL